MCGGRDVSQAFRERGSIMLWFYRWNEPLLFQVRPMIMLWPHSIVSVTVSWVWHFLQLLQCIRGLNYKLWSSRRLVLTPCVQVKARENSQESCLSSKEKKNKRIRTSYWRVSMSRETYCWCMYNFVSSNYHWAHVSLIHAQIRSLVFAHFNSIFETLCKGLWLDTRKLLDLSEKTLVTLLLTIFSMIMRERRFN